jgi:N-acetylmuramoyl-L-alanine amidase
MPSGASVQDTPSEADQDQPAWVGLQMRHQQQSRYLASTIQRSLGESGTFDNVTVSGVPLVTLMGTDLPAVLVEVGCIHPVAAPNPEVIERELNEYAQSIASAIATALPGLVR